MKKKCTFPATLCAICLMTVGQMSAFAQNASPGQNGTSGENTHGQNAAHGQNATSGQNMASGQNVAPIEFVPDSSGVSYKGNASGWQSHVATNADHQAMITLADKDGIYYYLVDSSFRLINQYSEDKDSLPFNYFKDKYEVALQCAEGQSFHTFIHRKNGSEVYVQTPNFMTGVSTFRKYLQFAGKERFLTAFQQEGHIYFLTHSKNVPELNVYTDSIATPARIALRLQDSTLDLGDALKDITVFREGKEPNMLYVRGKAKFYIRPGRPYLLTLDNGYKNTICWAFGLNDTASEAKVIWRNTMYCNYVNNESAIQGNSFVYQDLILQATYCGRDLLMQLKNMVSDSVIAEFHAVRDSAISFASSELIVKDRGTINSSAIFGPHTKYYDESKTKDLRTKDLFRAIGRSDLAFVIVPQDDYLLIKTGEAHKYSQQMYGGTGGMILNPTYAAVKLAGNIIAYGGIEMSNWPTKEGQVETYIMTALKRDNLEFVPHFALETNYDKLDYACSQLRTVWEAQSIFSLDGKTYVFYWDKKAKKLMIQQVI